MKKNRLKLVLTALTLMSLAVAGSAQAETKTRDAVSGRISISNVKYSVDRVKGGYVVHAMQSVSNANGSEDRIISEYVVAGDKPPVLTFENVKSASHKKTHIKPGEKPALSEYKNNLPTLGIKN